MPNQLPGQLIYKIYIDNIFDEGHQYNVQVVRRYPYGDQMLLRRVDAQMMLKDGSHTARSDDAEMISLKHILNLALAQGLYCGHRLVM